MHYVKVTDRFGVGGTKVAFAPVKILMERENVRGTSYFVEVLEETLGHRAGMKFFVDRVRTKPQ